MNFIEQWLHVSPDRGSGTLELAYYVVIAVGVAWVGRSLRGRLRRRS